MRRLRPARESAQPLTLSDDLPGGSGGDQQLDAGDGSTDWEPIGGNEATLIRSDSASRVERKVQGLVGKLKSSMKGLGLPSRSTSVKADDGGSRAGAADAYGSQPATSEGRQRGGGSGDWQRTSPQQPWTPDGGSSGDDQQRDMAAVQRGKIGFKMNRFSLPVFAAAVGAELRGYGVVSGADGGGAAAGDQAALEKDPGAAQDAWPSGGLDPWTRERPAHDPWSAGAAADRGSGDSWWPSAAAAGGQSPSDDPWAASAASLRSGAESSGGGAVERSLGAAQRASEEPWPSAPEWRPLQQQQLLLPSEPSGSREQQPQSQQPQYLRPQAAARASPGASCYVTDGVRSTPSAFGTFHLGGGEVLPAEAAADEWPAADETTGGGGGGIRLGKLKLPSFRRMAEAAVDVLRGPTDGMEAQLPVGSRDPSAVPLALEGSATPRPDVRTLLREKLQRGFKRSSSASAGLGTMAAGNDPWPASSSSSKPAATSSYGQLPGSSAGSCDDDAFGYRSAAGAQVARATP